MTQSMKIQEREAKIEDKAYLTQNEDEKMNIIENEIFKYKSNFYGDLIPASVKPLDFNGFFKFDDNLSNNFNDSMEWNTFL